MECWELSKIQVVIIKGIVLVFLKSPVLSAVYCLVLRIHQEYCAIWFLLFQSQFQDL